jgi:protein TonB
VPDSYIAQLPKVLAEDPKLAEGKRGGTGIYPAEARRLGIEAAVKVRVGIDRQGRIRSVRAIDKVGYGMEEAAVQSMWRFRWSPAITNDGRAVDFLITYTFRFQPEK